MSRFATTFLAVLLALGFAVAPAMAGPGSAMATASTVAAAAAAATPAAPGAGDPRIGDKIDYINESGGTIATLEVARVVQPWKDYGDYYAPDPGSEYVAFEIKIEHFGTRGDLLVSPDDFYLQDVDGFLLSRSWTTGATGAELQPTSDPIAIAPGKKADVVVVFEVLTGVDLSHLYWQPDYDRLITLVDLRN